MVKDVETSPDDLTFDTPWGGRLGGKVAIVTGAADGIGRASALLFAREGASVVGVDLLVEGGEETVRLVRAAGGAATFVRADIGERADAERIVSETMASYGGVDVLFNNAGIMPEGTALTQSVDDWDRTLRTNLTAIFLLARAAIPQMLARGGGSIVNTSSVMGLRGHQDRIAYIASKHARQGIRVNALCPGTINTPMLHRVLDTMPDRAAALRSFAALHPVGFIGAPEDVAFAALYLASDEARFVTGVVLPVDGGYTSLIM
jgi:NAD(P)-dependent dehydrogenase (short-subunit alcohol dehydrogenase family)